MINQKAFEIYAIGLVHTSVCSSLTLKETIKRVNNETPTGISSRWKLSMDKKFADGQMNPCPCEESPDTHVHYLLNC